MCVLRLEGDERGVEERKQTVITHSSTVNVERESVEKVVFLMNTKLFTLKSLEWLKNFLVLLHTHTHARLLQLFNRSHLVSRFAVDVYTRSM